jgi:DNA-binding NarL/FixJ family response regulator
MNNSLHILYTHRLIADAIKCLIEQQTPYQITGLWELNAIDYQPVKKAEGIILLEISKPSHRIIDLVKQMKASGRKVIVVGFLVNNSFVEEIINSGLDAFVLKSCGKLNLINAIEQVRSNHRFFCSSITEVLNSRLQGHSGCTKNQLTEREKEVLKGLVNMNKTLEIAEHLAISIATVRTHRKNIMRKFGAKNYIGLLRIACREGLLHDGDNHFCEGCAKIKCNSPLFG